MKSKLLDFFGHPLFNGSLSLILLEKILKVVQNYSRALTYAKVLKYTQAVRLYSIKGYSKAVAKAMDYIYSNLSQKIGLREVAEKTFINPSHLSRQFKRETGYTITDYINMKKVERAKFIFEENNSINEVAFMLGFSEDSYFNKVFKKHARITPSKYIKLLNKK